MQLKNTFNFWAALALVLCLIMASSVAQAELFQPESAPADLNSPRPDHVEFSQPTSVPADRNGLKLTKADFSTRPVSSSDDANTPALAEPDTAAKAPITEVELISPAGFQRVDGLDHDLNEMLFIFQSAGAKPLALFSEPKAWKRFYDEIYGTLPSDLAYYATITVLDREDGSVGLLDLIALEESYALVAEAPPELSWNEDEAALVEAEPETAKVSSTPFVLLEQGENFLTFKTEVGVARPNQGGGKAAEDRYLAVISALDYHGLILFLNFYATDQGPLEGVMVDAARQWRDKYLSKNLPTTLPGLISEPEPSSSITAPLSVKTE